MRHENKRSPKRTDDQHKTVEMKETIANSTNKRPPPPLEGTKKIDQSSQRLTLKRSESNSPTNILLKQDRSFKIMEEGGEAVSNLSFSDHHPENSSPTRSTSMKKQFENVNNNSSRLVKENTKMGREVRTGKPAPETSSVPDRYNGENVIQYGLWAHFVAYGSAAFCILLGMFAIIYTFAVTNSCKINGQEISSSFLYNPDGTCPTVYQAPSGIAKKICCNPNSAPMITGNSDIGVVYLLYGIFICIYENVPYGYGLWFPNDTIFFKKKVSFIGIVHFIIGIVGVTTYVTFLAGACLMTTGVVYQYAAYRGEAGDGGRSKMKAEHAKKKGKDDEKPFSESVKETCQWMLSFNPVTFLRRIYNEDKLSSYFWVFVFVAINLILFWVTFSQWLDIVDTMQNQLLDGTLDVHCDTRLCHTNRKAVRYGQLSIYAAFAKAFGNLLNLNGALLLLPVTKILLHKLNNIGQSFSLARQSTDYFARLFAHPLTRYVPLFKNIEFHKMVAITIFVCSWAHLIFHLLNLIYSSNVTLEFFRFAGWYGTDYFTGAIVSFAMFMLYPAAQDIIRMTKYEIFYYNHVIFLTVFFLIMFLHGPVFFYWSAIPVLLYITERYLQTQRGNKPYLVEKVEFIPPVMAIYFRPVFKEDFPFKEGQYLYLNCPYISNTEWHPFTISSASDDMNNGPRVHLETGEEVVEIPRPDNYPSTSKWNKYCLVSKDWKKLEPYEYLDKSETGYLDYVSVHVKVHGLDEPYARTWTRKLKEYFELLSPGKKFPFYFAQRDTRGEIMIGKQKDPQGNQILRVDGPHAAPAEHYCNYGTVMLIGAGIGLTPCASILTALTKYRWKKNYNPELLHFYWIVRQNEIDSFQWLMHMLTDIMFEMKKGKAMNQIERRYYCEINIYVTGVEKKPVAPTPLYRPRRKFDGGVVKPTFTADEIYEKMLNPTVDSKGQIKKMKESNPTNRLQDVWIWNGRPNWDEIFKEMKEQRQHSDIGVCFCGAPVIGADLRAMCEKYSNSEEDCLFTLHKENF